MNVIVDGGHAIRHCDDAVVSVGGREYGAVDADIRCHARHHESVDSPAAQGKLERRPIELVIRVRLDDEVAFLRREIVDGG